MKLTGKKDKPLVPLAITEVDTTKGPNFFGGQAATPGGMMGGPLSAPQMQARSDPFAPVGSRPMGATPGPRRSFRERPERSERPRGNGTPVLPNPRDAQTNNGSESVPPVTFPSSSGGPVGNQLPPLGGVQRGPDSIPAAPPAQNPLQIRIIVARQEIRPLRQITRALFGFVSTTQGRDLALTPMVSYVLPLLPLPLRHREAILCCGHRPCKLQESTVRRSRHFVKHWRQVPLREMSSKESLCVTSVLGKSPRALGLPAGNSGV